LFSIYQCFVILFEKEVIVSIYITYFRASTFFPLLIHGIPSPCECPHDGVGVELLISPSPYLAKVEDIFELEIIVDAGPQPIDGAELYIDFDPAYLTIVNPDGSGVSELLRFLEQVAS